MSTEFEGISADDLLAAAWEQGFEISHVQRARWHRAGWLPTPHKEHLGKGYGTRSIYPEVARGQFLTICAIPERQRRTPLVEWCLWWRGYEMPMTAIRDFLGQAAAEWETAVRELATPDGLSDTAIDAVEQLETQRLPRRTLKRSRKRVGANRFPTYGYLMLMIAAGRFTGWQDPDDAEAAERGLGLRRGRTRPAGKWAPQDIAPDLTSLSQLMEGQPFSRLLTTMTDSELITARDELRRFVGQMETMSHAVARAVGVDLLKDALAQSMPVYQATLLLFWTTLRAAGLATVINTETQTEQPRKENAATPGLGQ